MQKMLAGTKPNWAVRKPMKQTMTLLAPAMIQPCHSLRPTRMVEATVRTQEM